MQSESFKIRFVINDKELSFKDFLGLAQKVWPGSYNEQLCQRALEKTINITAWDKNVLIGCVRILSDGYFFSTIPEILVIPEYQKAGVGERLMELAWENSPSSIFLGAQPGNEGFFEKLGYKKSMQSYVKKRQRKS